MGQSSKAVMVMDRRIYKATVSGVALLSIAGFVLTGCNRTSQSSATSTAPPPLAALPLSTVLSVQRQLVSVKAH